jgi:hypothetical protein
MLQGTSIRYNDVMPNKRVHTIIGALHTETECSGLCLLQIDCLHRLRSIARLL